MSPKSRIPSEAPQACKEPVTLVLEERNCLRISGGCWCQVPLHQAADTTQFMTARGWRLPGWGTEGWDTLSLDGERASHLPAPFLSNTFLLIQQSKSRVRAREKLGGEGRQAN